MKGKLIFGYYNNKIVTFDKATFLKKDEVILEDNIEKLKKISGIGTYIDNQTSQLKAKYSGYLRIFDEKIFVDKLEVIEENITINHKKKEFLSSVWIKGDIFNGSEINVIGNLQIDGTVENVSIKCYGNIIINGNVFGQNRAKIAAKGDIIANNITEAKVYSFGNIIANDFVRHSNLYSKKSIIVNGRGEISGGIIYSRDSIVSKIIGSKNVIKTLIILGYNFKQKAKFDELKKSLKKMQLTFEKNKNSLVSLLPDIPFETENDYINFIMKNINNDSHKLYSLKSLENIKLIEQILSIKSKIKNFSMKQIANFDAYLKTEHIFPGVTIRILDKKIDILEDISGEIEINRRNIEKWLQ